MTLRKVRKGPAGQNYQPPVRPPGSRKTEREAPVSFGPGPSQADPDERVPKRRRLEANSEHDATAPRVHRPSLEHWLDNLAVSKELPDYTGKSDPAAGSAEIEVILGPKSDRGGANDANPRLPSGITSARNTYEGKCKFIAGHMLNSDLGGDGKDWKNMTILTSQANADMRGYEANLKKAVYYLNQLYKALLKAAPDNKALKTWSDSGCGIQVTVKTVGQWGREPPDSYICKHVVMKAKVVKDKGLNFSGMSGLDNGTREDLKGVLALVKLYAAQATGSIPNSKPGPAWR
ncbi:hypothetical protein [Ferrovibrio sp.]|uniref:hypothetical protein n=1 Tax=Ferrovibrio sp. TaxID=1917215 RepID=UPI00311D526B